MRCASCGSTVSPWLYRCGNCDELLPPPPGAGAAGRATAAFDVPAPEIRLTDGLGQVVIAGIWLAAVTEAVVILVLTRAVQTRMPGETVTLGWSELAVCTAAIGLELVVGLLFVGWLVAARGNLDAFGDTRAEWGRWSALWAWFVPVANVILVPTIVADVARTSADDAGGAEGRAQVRRVWTWWIVCLGRPLVSWVGVVAVAPLLADALRWFDPGVVGFLAAAVPGVAVTAGAALLGGRVVGGVCREQRQRAERLAPVVPPVLRGTIGA